MSRVAILLATALLAATPLAGCSLGQSLPDGAQFLLRVEHSRAAVAPKRDADVVTVEAAKVAAPYGDRRFVYRRAGGAYDADPYHGFLALPSAMLTDATIQWLQNCGPFKTVCGEGVVLQSDFRLQQLAQVVCADFLPGLTQAVVQIHYYLTDERSSPAKIILDRGYVGTAPLADGKPETVAAGLNAALADVLKRMTDDVRAATADN